MWCFHFQMSAPSHHLNFIDVYVLLYVCIIASYDLGDTVLWPYDMIHLKPVIPHVYYTTTFLEIKILSWDKSMPYILTLCMHIIIWLLYLKHVHKSLHMGYASVHNFSFVASLCQVNCLRTNNKLSLGELICLRHIYVSKYFCIDFALKTCSYK